MSQLQKIFQSILCAGILLSFTLASCKENRSIFTVSKFQKIYDPSIGEKEDWYINDHSIIKGKDGLYHLFGTTGKEPKDKKNIYLQIDADKEKFLAHATSPDLLKPQWKKEDFPLQASEKFGEIHIWAPFIIQNEGLYYMFYAVGDTAKNSNSKIHLATSSDLYKWERHSKNPIVVDKNARDPFVMKVGNEWVMHYTMNDSEKNGFLVVSHRKSTDLILWGERSVSFYDQKNGVGSESPSILKMENRYYLLIGPRPGKSKKMFGTEIFESENPFQFSSKRKVGKIDSHASEVFQNTDGKMYISHCGWGNGGVYLGELKKEVH